MVAPTKTKEAQHNVTFAEGGNTPMFGEQAAGPEKAGTTAVTKAPAPGPKFAAGGSGKMFGFSPSQAQQAGRTGAR